MRAYEKIITVILFLTFLAGEVKADILADSIRLQIPKLTGENLLHAYSNLCRLAASKDDADYELRCIREFMNEAISQHNVEAEGLARSYRINCYYNYCMHDSLTSVLPENLAAMAKNKTWDYYYNSWNTLIEMYIYQDKLKTALSEAQKMYADARQRKSNYGLGVSSYCIGSIYQTMGRFAEAEKSLEESILDLSKEEDITLLLSSYNALSETLDALGKYDKLRVLASKWEKVLNKYREESRAKGYEPSLEGRYLYCTLASAIAELECGKYDEAYKLLKLAENYAQGRKQISRYKLLQVEARYYTAIRQYEKAIACNSANLTILAEEGDSVSMLTVQKQQADLFLAAGYYKQAASLYQTIIPHKDKLRNNEFAKQLDELRTIYEVDKLVLRNKITSTRLYFAISISLSLLLIVILYIIYTRLLRRKNRVLYNTIVRHQNSAKEMEYPSKLILEEQLNNEEQLYLRLCALMQQEELFKDPELNREILSERLGTNHTYLAEAVRMYAGGITISEFINNYRLRQATVLLSSNHDLNINEVEYMTGFKSRATFSRLFKISFGMSPSEYRAISKETKVESSDVNQT